jgi:hypothetical protein
LHGSQPSLGTTSSIDPHVNSTRSCDAVRILCEPADNIAAATIFFVLAWLIKIIVGVFFELRFTDGVRKRGMEDLSAVR